MKELENNYYKEGTEELLNKQDYKLEMERVEEEKKAKEKYEKDEIIKAELARKESVKKQAEEAARKKELEDRKARIETRKQVLVDEEKERERIKEQRQKAINNFNNLDTDDMLSVLNDGDDMQIYYENLFSEGYERYLSEYKKEMDELPDFSKDLTEENLKQADVLFHMLFGDIAEFEKPFLVSINGDKVPETPEKLDNMIVGNFILNQMTAYDFVNDKIKDKVTDPDTVMRYQKYHVLKKIADYYYRIEKDYEEEAENNAETIKEETDKKIIGKSDKEIETIKAQQKEALLKANAESKAKLFKVYTDRLQYRGFIAEKLPNGKMEVLRPALDFGREYRSRKFWLARHPEKKDVNYAKDELDYQLGFVKKMASFVAKEQKVPESIYGDDTKDRTPISLNRTKYELRELRAAFNMHAEATKEFPLKKFNEGIAFLTNYEEGDFKRLMREKPHMAHLLDVIINGPLVSPVEGKTQLEVYKEIEENHPGELKAYLKFANAILAQVSVEYKKQKLADANYPAKEEEAVKEASIDATDGLYYAIEDLKKSKLYLIDDYCTKPISDAFDKREQNNILDDAEIISNEVSALARGWKMKDTLIFAVIYQVYSNSRALYKQNRRKYDKIYSDLGDIAWNIGKAKTAVEKRNYLNKFEQIIRDNIDDKALVGSLESAQIEYDSVRQSFDDDYKNTVIADLNKLKKDPEKLAKSMTEMQRIAIANEEPFHDVIFKEFIDSLDGDAQDKLQRALYNERMNQMIKRAQNVIDYTDELYKRKELADFKYNPTIKNDIKAQIGRIVSQNDGVAAVDRLFLRFDNPISADEKAKLNEEYKKKNIESKEMRVDGKLYARGEGYYDMELAELIENNKPVNGIHVVTAPDGGFNINYDKDIIEIRKNVFEKAAPQYEDIKLEIAMIRTAMNTYLETARSMGKVSVGYEGIYYNMYRLATMQDNMSISAWISDLESIVELTTDRIKELEGKDNQKETDYLKEVNAFSKKKLELLNPKNYPDVDFEELARDLNRQIETTKVLWENKAEGNKFEPKPTEYIKNKEAQAEKDNVTAFYKAIATSSSRKNLDHNEGYESGYGKTLKLKPATILEMCEKYFGALQALDGNDVSKESIEYQNFYYSLKDLKEHFNVREVDPEDGSNVTKDCLDDLVTSMEEYLKSDDKSKNADLRRNVVYQIKNNYLYVVSGYDKYDNVDNLNTFVNNDSDISKSIRNLSDDAKKNRQDRIDAEKKAAEDEKKANDAEDEKKNKLEQEHIRINVERQKLEDRIKVINSSIKDEERQARISNENLVKFSSYPENRKETWRNTVKECEQKIKNYKKELSDIDNRKATLDKAWKDADRLYAPKEIAKKKVVLKRQEIKDMMRTGKKPEKKVRKKVNKKPEQKVEQKVDKTKQKVEQKVDKKPVDINIKNEDNIKKANVNNRINIIEDNNNLVGEDIPPVKNDKASVKDNKKGYEQYFLLHTGENKGKDYKTKVDNFGKVVAAYALRANENDFSIKMIHAFKDGFIDNLCFGDLSEADLDKYLADPKSALNGADKIRSEIYGIKEGNYDKFSEDMQKLRDNLMDPKNRSTEFQQMAGCIKKAAALKDEKFETDKKREDAYSQAALMVAFTVTKYMKGKKSVRVHEGGNYRFDNALDALAIVSKYTKNGIRRANKLIDRINEVRGNKKPINKGDFVDKYGASRASTAHEKWLYDHNAEYRRHIKWKAKVDEEIIAGGVEADEKKLKAPKNLKK